LRSRSSIKRPSFLVLIPFSAKNFLTAARTRSSILMLVVTLRGSLRSSLTIRATSSLSKLIRMPHWWWLTSVSATQLRVSMVIDSLQKVFGLCTVVYGF